MSKKKSRKATGMQLEEVNENFREGQDEDAKINIIIGLPEITSVSPQVAEEEAKPAKQLDQIPLDPPQQSAPQPEVLHSGRIQVRKGIEQKLIEDSVNASLSPVKAKQVKNKDVYSRLYADHENKAIEDKIITDGSPLKKVLSSSPKPPRVYVIGADLQEKRQKAAEDYIQERIKETHPQINPVSRHLADRQDPTPDRRAFSGKEVLIPPPRKDLSLQERTQIEADRDGLSFRPKIIPLNRSILASPANSGTTAAGAAGAAPTSSSVSTPPSKRTGETDESGEKVPVHDRLLLKGEELKRMKENLKKKADDKAEKECPHKCEMDPHSSKILSLSKSYNFFDSCNRWVYKHKYIGAQDLGSSGASGASTDRVRPASADSGEEGDEAGAQTARERGSRNMWGERGTWVGNRTYHESSEELEELGKKFQPLPLPRQQNGDRKWMDKTFGVKNFLRRAETARRWKEEKPLINPNRRYPRKPTKICEFNLTKTKRELELKKEEESFEA